MKRLFNVCTTAGLTVALLSACVEQSAIRDDPGLQRTVSADDLMVVDCLLPGQVRQLGTRATYISARRPLQTTAHDCVIRGGEYVAYDRATFASALKVWMPLAEQGDADAQNKIGEIYERGLGDAPEYELAAIWYRKAAEQGLSRAQISLGFLYEKGLGVKKDPEAALSWYRKASNMPDAVMIDKQALDAQKAQIASLRKDLARSRKALKKARESMRQSERRLQKERNRQRQQLQQGGPGLTDAQRRRIEQSREKLNKQRVELARRQERIRELESTARRQQESLLLFETEGNSQRTQLQLVNTQLTRAQKDLQQYQKLASKNEKLLAQTRADLAALAKDKNSEAHERISELARQLSDREQNLGRKEGAVRQLEKRITELQSKLKKARDVSTLGKTQSQQALAQMRVDLAKARASAADSALALEQARSELVEMQDRQGKDGIKVAALEVQLKERERTLAEQRSTVARLNKESDQLRQKLQQLKAEQATAKAKTKVPDAGAITAPPSIQLIDPPLLAVRGGTTKIPIKRGLKHRTVVGRVVAPAGLYALNINGVRLHPDAKGLFETDVQVASSETPVSMVAIDKQGRRSTLAFSLIAQGGDSEERLVAKRLNPLKDVEIGSFHALLIGNQDYDSLPDLDTAIADVEEVAKMLKTKFGYKVTLLRNADRYQVLSALNKLRKELTENDNLLVYYAGHGELDRVNLRGHWLPVDAEVHSTANWISNVSITDILNAMSVRHVLMVADSCYSGSLTRSALSQLAGGQSDSARSHWLKTLSQMRSRTALTSGGLAPVLDGGGGNHSVFAKAFLGVLRDLSDITEGQRVYRDVSARVAFEATKFQVEQVPEYAPIKFAGHEAGDYLFVPKTYLY